MRNLPTSNLKRKIGIIADDLTGANDAGVQFCKAGLTTTVLIQCESITQVLACSDVIVMDTCSRHLEPEQARKSARDAAALLVINGVSRVYKKVDSTLRGNAGAEIDGIIDATGADLCILAPAFPANGRTTVRGHQLLAGLPLQDSEAGEDILSPVQTSYVPDIIADQSTRKVAPVFLDVVRQGEHVLANRLVELHRSGNEILVLDAVEKDDLLTIATAAELTGLSYLASGSAGFAAELAGVLGVNAEERQALRRKPEQGILVVVGSASKTSADQVSMAATIPRVALIKLDAALLSSGRVPNPLLQEICETVCSDLAGGNDVIVSVARSDDVSDCGDVSLLIEESLAHVVDSAVSLNLVLGMVTTGGDTSAAVVRALGAVGLNLRDEVLPGIPLGLIVGGRADGLPIITKAGGFGDSDALVVAINRLRNCV